MSNLRIKKKHIDSKAIDGSKIELLADEALKAISNGVAVDLIKINAEGVVSAKNLPIAYSSEVSSEASSRVAADSSLQTRLSTEESARASAIVAEASSRVAGDGSLETRLSSEESARASAVTAEASSRVAADNSLQSRLSTEESARAAAITTEASLRVASDESVVARLQDIMGSVSPDIVETLTGIANMMTDGDPATGILDAIAAERSLRIAADSSLQTRVSAEEAARADVAAGHRKYDKELLAADISNGYMDLLDIAKANSIMLMVDRLAIHEGVDYTVNLTGGANGKTRITFIGSLAAGGDEALAAGSRVYAKFMA